MRRVLLLLLLPAIAGAQTIRGTVVSRGDSVGVPGAVVQLVDSAGSVVARTLSNERGGYIIAAPSAGAYRVRTLRIGFRPTTSDVLDLGAGREVEYQVVLAGLPFLLDTVHVAERNVCRASSDSGDATAAIWEQARTALTAAQLTARIRSLTATVVTYERTLGPNSDRVMQQTSAISSGFTVRPWTSLPPETLRRVGYVVTDRNDMMTYHAPDLDVLLSPSWVADHCFRVAKSKDPALLGIAFEPTPDRSQVAELRGTLWLHKQSSELRRMEFFFTNIPREQADEARGQMDFVRMANGAWAISRWSIRMPVFEQRLASRPGEERSLAEIRVVGGELALAARGADTLFALPPLIMAGTVLDSASGYPVGSARLTIAGTQLEGVTDSRGHFAIRNVLPGEYTLEVRTPALDSIGAHVLWPLTFADSKTPLVYRAPSVKQVARSRAAVFAGTVIADSSRQPIAGAEVAIVARSLSAFTDDRGGFRLTDIPPGTHEVVVRRIGYGPLTVNVAFAANETLQRQIVLSRVAMLDTVAVAASSLLPDFEENRRLGLGHFLTRADLDKMQGRRLSGVLSEVKTVGIVAGKGTHAFIISTRAAGSLSVQQGYERAISRGDPHPFDSMRKDGSIPAHIYCPEPGEFDAQGIKCSCYARVYVDRMLMNPEEPAHPFDVNTFSADQIEAIEFYGSESETPMRYSRRGAHCGVLVIHLRHGR